MVLHMIEITFGKKNKSGKLRFINRTNFMTNEWS